ncbi:MAG TPA: type II toxin-antitoxin system prevent-host-death family antitoxin [Thiotrichaceae bacterium]|nr:type II toxin-antitoxin system prevent-host-death family antitoxin [Thiotrichaceae bacterium]
MINQQYSWNQVPNHWSDIRNQVEEGYSVIVTHNSEIVALLVPVRYNKPPQQNFWHALQTFRQQVELTELDDDIFSDVRDRSPGREVLL